MDLDSQATTVLTFISVVLSYLECHINGLLQGILFRVWLFSRSIMFYRVFHVVVGITILFLFIADFILFCCMDILPVDGHLGCCQFLALTNKVAMNIYVQVFGHLFSFLSLET